MGDKDRSDLGVRQKELEHATRHFLPEDTYTMVRVDGKAFHTWCRGLLKPYDIRLVETMRQTMLSLAERAQDCVLAYCQSDEITLVLAGYTRENSQAWFDGNLQKIASVCAGTASAHFNAHAAKLFTPEELSSRDLAIFDGRAWPLRTPSDVLDNIRWRIIDAERNSASMLGQGNYSHRELHGVSRRDLIERLAVEKGVVWADEPGPFRTGSVCVKRKTSEPVTFTHKRTGEVISLDAVERTYWSLEDAPRPFEVDAALGPMLPHLHGCLCGRCRAATYQVTHF